MGSESALEYGVMPFLMSLFALRLARDDSFSGLESLTLIALSCNPKLSPAGQHTVKHDGLYPVSLTVPPFVEHFQQRDDPCRVGFYALAFLSFLRIPY